MILNLDQYCISTIWWISHEWSTNLRASSSFFFENLSVIYDSLRLLNKSNMVSKLKAWYEISIDGPEILFMSSKPKSLTNSPKVKKSRNSSNAPEAWHMVLDFGSILHKTLKFNKLIDLIHRFIGYFIHS